MRGISSVLYLVREPVAHISQALYIDVADDAIVVRIDLNGVSSGPFAEILKPGTAASFHSGQSLTSRELLELVMNTQKIMTL
jgi:hypothetical protein